MRIMSFLLVVLESSANYLLRLFLSKELRSWGNRTCVSIFCQSFPSSHEDDDRRRESTLPTKAKTLFSQ